MTPQKPSSNEKKPKSMNANKSKTGRTYTKWILVFIVLVVLLVAEFGFFKGTHYYALCRTVSLKFTTSAWKRSLDRPKIQNEITSNLTEMSNFLESGDIDSAMQYIHPDQQSRYSAQFTANPDRIPGFIEGLRSAKVIFISEKLNAYDTNRMARVQLVIPEDPASPVEESKQFKTTLTCIFLEERWVIDS